MLGSMIDRGKLAEHPMLIYHPTIPQELYVIRWTTQALFCSGHMANKRSFSEWSWNICSLDDDCLSQVHIFYVYSLYTLHLHMCYIQTPEDSNLTMSSDRMHHWTYNSVQGVVVFMGYPSMLILHLVKLPSDECNWILLMINRHWFR